MQTFATILMILILIFISVFAYIFFKNLYYVKNHPCVVCIEQEDAVCYFNEGRYYMENNVLKKERGYDIELLNLPP